MNSFLSFLVFFGIGQAAPRLCPDVTGKNKEIRQKIAAISPSEHGLRYSVPIVYHIPPIFSRAFLPYIGNFLKFGRLNNRPCKAFGQNAQIFVENLALPTDAGVFSPLQAQKEKGSRRKKRGVEEQNGAPARKKTVFPAFWHFSLKYAPICEKRLLPLFCHFVFDIKKNLCYNQPNGNTRFLSNAPHPQRKGENP